MQLMPTKEGVESIDFEDDDID